MNGYFKGYNEGIEDTKRNILEVIEKYHRDEPRVMLEAIVIFCESKEYNKSKQ